MTLGLRSVHCYALQFPLRLKENNIESQFQLNFLSRFIIVQNSKILPVMVIDWKHEFYFRNDVQKRDQITLRKTGTLFANN